MIRLSVTSMNPECSPVVASNHDGIACVAFQLWEKAGCPEGRDLDFWLGAETSFRSTKQETGDGGIAKTLLPKSRS